MHCKINGRKSGKRAYFYRDNNGYNKKKKNNENWATF